MIIVMMNVRSHWADLNLIKKNIFDKSFNKNNLDKKSMKSTKAQKYTYVHTFLKFLKIGLRTGNGNEKIKNVFNKRCLHCYTHQKSFVI